MVLLRGIGDGVVGERVGAERDGAFRRFAGAAGAASAGSGMPRLRQPERHQLGWQVATIDDLVARDHPARAVWALSKGLICARCTTR
jgi:hypothetical protein